MKNIFFTVYLCFTFSIFSAEPGLKKTKTTIAIEPICLSYEHIPDEVRLMIVKNLTSQNQHCTNFDIEKAKAFRRFGLASKETMLLLCDKHILNNQSGSEIIYLAPKIWSNCNILAKHHVLESIYNQESDVTKALICKRVSKAPNSRLTFRHPLIDNAINNSNVGFFQDVQKMLNLKFPPVNIQETFLGTIPVQPFQSSLVARALLVHRQRLNENYEYLQNTINKPLNLEELQRHNQKVLDAFQILRITGGDSLQLA